MIVCILIAGKVEIYTFCLILIAVDFFIWIVDVGVGLHLSQVFFFLLKNIKFREESLVATFDFCVNFKYLCKGCRVFSHQFWTVLLCSSRFRVVRYIKDKIDREWFDFVKLKTEVRKRHVFLDNKKIIFYWEQSVALIKNISKRYEETRVLRKFSDSFSHNWNGVIPSRW